MGVAVRRNLAWPVADKNGKPLFDAGGKPLPAQFTKTVPWDDGSVRWALLDFVGSFAPNEKADWILAIGEGVKPAAPAKPVTVETTAVGKYRLGGYRRAGPLSQKRCSQ